jgi:16S rRNA (guanine527-N7)-methyltransferase
VSYLELLEKELSLFRLDIPPSQRALLALYCDELQRWNQKINLTGLSGVELVRRLVIEPVWIASELEMSGIVVDIGSGNGSPAVPLHIVRRFDRDHLIEVRAKRAAFLRHLVSVLKLEGVVIHQARFEDITEQLTGSDWVTLQGVALTSKLADAIRSISDASTTAVWITAEVEPKLKAFRTLQVPITGTRVFLFHLDQS